ncbi:MAG: adenine deaminase [Candidatus Heimdallarchaeota archaeon]|nr:adenine deaminase [Candidatus Heimdallarchaeota archaeon]
MQKIQGNIVDVFSEEIYPAEIKFDHGIITNINRVQKKGRYYILPGLVDAHIHIESSLLTPSRFAEVTVPHGTVATVSDPHEIANVLGIEGIDYLEKDGKNVPLKFFWTAPSCVPATPFETSGATLGPESIKELLNRSSVVSLGEVMNYPGVVNGDPTILKKINLAKAAGKPIDGHCPGLSGKDLKKYVATGISTEHEAVTLTEAQEKAALGMKIMVREGSSAKNLEDIISVKGERFLVSDDKHPHDLLKGHLNVLLKKVVTLGPSPIEAIKMVSKNPILHYDLPVGLLREGDPADFVLVKDLKNFRVVETWIEGVLVAKKGKALFSVNPVKRRNTIKLEKTFSHNFEIRSKEERPKVRIIKVIKNQIYTEELQEKMVAYEGKLLPNIEKDLLKIATVERYGHGNIGLGIVHGFGLKTGAIASSVAHDSHNIIVVGTNAEDMASAVNSIKALGGGLVVVKKEKLKASLALPVAGLMSTRKASTVAKALKKLHKVTKKLGCVLPSPFMTLSFLALLVIPKLKLSDQGLFDGEKFAFVDLIV